MIIRLVKPFPEDPNDPEILFDLSNGELHTECIGVIKGHRVYSAEALLCELEGYSVGDLVNLKVTPYSTDDIEEIGGR